VYLRIDDGKAVFATYLLACTLPPEPPVELFGWHIEPEGVVVWPNQNVADAEAVLTKVGIAYTVQQLTVDAATQAKAQGVTYASRSEALDHLTNNVVPGSLVVPNLQSQLAALQQSHNSLQTQLATVQQSFNKLTAALQTKGIISGL
jgi:hypothetical protein